MTIAHVPTTPVPAFEFDFRRPQDPALGALPLLGSYVEFVAQIAATPFVPEAMRNQPHVVLACILKGYEVGFAPMQSLDSIDVIKGRPGIKPEAMRGLIVREGHQIAIPENTDEAVTIAVHRKEWEPERWERFRWTMADAKRAELTGNPSWKRYPRAMLLARATSEAARAHFADVIKGLSYTPEELESIPAPTFRPATPTEALPTPAELEAPAVDGKAALQRRVDEIKKDPAVASEMAAQWKANGITPIGSKRFSAKDLEAATHLVEEAERRLAPSDNKAVAELTRRVSALPDNLIALFDVNRMSISLPSLTNLSAWTPDKVLLAEGLIAELEELAKEAPFSEPDPAPPAWDVEEAWS